MTETKFETVAEMKAEILDNDASMASRILSLFAYERKTNTRNANFTPTERIELICNSVGKEFYAKPEPAPRCECFEGETCEVCTPTEETFVEIYLDHTQPIEKRLDACHEAEKLRTNHPDEITPRDCLTDQLFNSVVRDDENICILCSTDIHEGCSCTYDFDDQGNLQKTQENENTTKIRKMIAEVHEKSEMLISEKSFDHNQVQKFFKTANSYITTLGTFLT